MSKVRKTNIAKIAEKPETSLGPYQTSVMELFCENNSIYVLYPDGSLPRKISLLTLYFAML